jgi:hypothetical protein
MDPEACLMVLRNLMRQAYDREQSGAPAATSASPATADVAPKPAAAASRPAPAAAPAAAPAPQPKADGRPKPQKEPQRTPPKPPAGKPQPATAVQRKSGGLGGSDLEKLVSLRDMGILTEDEFQAARRRLEASRA